jgi:predicted ArsR family transcriptional regulator
MKKNLILGAGRGPRLAVLERIKRSGNGMSVKDLSSALGMSYMGVKAHCVALATVGYLTTWRKPVPKGRPLMLYRLADSGERLFAGSDEDLALELLREAAGLFGAMAPQKLLMMYFRTLATRYREKINAEERDKIGERLRAFVEIREREGRMSSFDEIGGGAGNWLIRESHNPLAAVTEKFPETGVMEENMVGEVLGVPVRRWEEGGVLLFSPR